MNVITQSAVSQSLSTFERQLHSILVERGKHFFNLTAQGKVAYDFCKQMVQTYDAIQEKIQQVQAVVANNIHLASVQSIGLYDLPRCIKRLQEVCPGVTVQVEYHRTTQIYEDVMRGEVDLGLIAFPNRHPNHKTVVFRHEALVLACHPQNPLAKLTVVKLKALRGAKMVGFERLSPTRAAVDKLFKIRRVRLACVMECDNLEVMKRAVEINSAVAIVPEGAIRCEVASGRLAAVRLEGDCFRPLAAIYRIGQELTPAMEKLIELLGEPV